MECEKVYRIIVTKLNLSVFFLLYQKLNVVSIPSLQKSRIPTPVKRSVFHKAPVLLNSKSISSTQSTEIQKPVQPMEVIKNPKNILSTQPTKIPRPVQAFCLEKTGLKNPKLVTNRNTQEVTRSKWVHEEVFFGSRNLWWTSEQRPSQASLLTSGSLSVGGWPIDWFGQQSSPCERKYGPLIHRLP
ncbi:uncharacterized protein LOC141866590 [Acropora palmata]|uniref:uncharacterized protein LOC141866590 n=1 Tax=Acropora palmata TaxID=6131 RepID=UPI003DA16EAB